MRILNIQTSTSGEYGGYVTCKSATVDTITAMHIRHHAVNDVFHHQRHSSSLVNINFRENKPPEFLYHGTASHFVSSSRQKGLIAGERHYVHLSEDKKTTTKVSKR